MSDISFPPEILQQIITFHEDNYKTLYSCLLVNKYWCRNVVPILWRNMPEKYKKKSPSAYKFIQAYINCLSTDTRAQLGLTKSDQQNESSVFLYPTYLKVFDLQWLLNEIVSWYGKLFRNIPKKQRRGPYEFLEAIINLLRTNKARIEKVRIVLLEPIKEDEKQQLLRIVTNLVKQSQDEEDGLLGKLREVHFSQYVFRIQEVFKLFARHCNNFQCLKLKNATIEKQPIRGLLKLIQAVAPNLEEITCENLKVKNLEIWSHISFQLSTSLRKITIKQTFNFDYDYLDFLLQFQNLETLELIGTFSSRYTFNSQYIISDHNSKIFPSLKKFIRRTHSNYYYALGIVMDILILSRNTLKSLILHFELVYNIEFLNELESLVTLTELTIKIDSTESLHNFLFLLEYLQNLKFLTINGRNGGNNYSTVTLPESRLLFPAALAYFEFSIRIPFTSDSLTTFLGYFDKLPRFIKITVPSYKLLGGMKNLALARGERIHRFGWNYVDEAQTWLFKFIWISLD
ncbi:11600_t:CDS:2 [Ambispora leptoticha]|uniref:11600_t:CDS:1 n=1 Tax=Ambispora leptoticha TaxID=144679 RepID=A0A9N9ACB7_9GLOM|nr:11600_t:CDS:2 [Ambispora leptoticha]